MSSSSVRSTIVQQFSVTIVDLNILWTSLATNIYTTIPIPEFSALPGPPPSECDCTPGFGFFLFPCFAYPVEIQDGPFLISENSTNKQTICQKVRFV